MPLRLLHPGKPVARWRLLPPLCVFALVGMLATGCFSRRSKRADAPPEAAAVVPVAVVETRIGIVRAIGAGQSFVLIETPSALATSALADGQLLHCRAPDAVSRTATADLRVSHERHQALIVANVVAGEATVGAVVYSTSDPAPTASPAPDSISAVSTAPLPGLFTPRKP